MNVRGHRLGWAPPLLVGASAAIAAEVAIGVLLYAGPGFLRSLTTILAVEGVALSLGLRGVPPRAPDLVEGLRRRWLLCLASFLVAATFGTGWSLVPGLGEDRLGQGLGLALLAALPLYACGAVLGGMGAVATGDASGSTRGPGAAAALGAAVGFVITGALLPRAPIPASLLVACLVLLSAGGMLYGMVLGGRLDVRVVASRSSPAGLVRVEDQRTGEGAPAARYLLEGDHVRAVSANGRGTVSWDVEIARALAPPGDAPWRVLSVGGGASALPRELVGSHHGASVDVLERSEAVVRLAREHLGTALPPQEEERCTVRVGNLDDLLADLDTAYDLVVVDAAALAPTGGLDALSRASRAAIFAAAGASGLTVWGGLTPDPGTPEPPPGWRQEVLRRGDRASGEVLVVAGPPHAPALPSVLGDFVASLREEPPA